MDGTHTGEIVSVAAHPTHAYAVTFGADGAWAFHDVGKAETLSVTRGDGAGYGVGGFHPDGLIAAACGVDGKTRLWDVKAQKRAAELEGHSDAVTSLSFSENGYYVATAAADGARVWDLRKLNSLLRADARAPTRKRTATRAPRVQPLGALPSALGSGSEPSVRAVKQDWEVVKQRAGAENRAIRGVRRGRARRLPRGASTITSACTREDS